MFCFVLFFSRRSLILQGVQRRCKSNRVERAEKKREEETTAPLARISRSSLFLKTKKTSSFLADGHHPEDEVDPQQLGDTRAAFGPHLPVRVPEDLRARQQRLPEGPRSRVPRHDGGDDDRRRCSRPQPQQQQQRQQQQRRLHNLYVKNLPEFVDEACLVALFSRFGGAVVSACVLRGTWTRGGKSRGGGGKGGRRRGGGGGSGDATPAPQNKTGSSSRSPDSSKRRGFVEMATAEGASAAIAVLDGKFLALREEEKEEEEEEEGGAGEGSSERELVALNSVALSPSLTLLVSDKPLSSFSSSSRAEGSHGEHCVRVAHAFSKESREQGAARAKAEARAATVEEARLRRARAAVDERNRQEASAVPFLRPDVSVSSYSSSSSSRWPPRGTSGGGREDAGR